MNAAPAEDVAALPQHAPRPPTAADDAAAPPRPERGMDAIPLRRAQQEPALVAAALERHSFAVIALGERDARAVRDPCLTPSRAAGTRTSRT